METYVVIWRVWYLHGNICPQLPSWESYPANVDISHALAPPAAPGLREKLMYKLYISWFNINIIIVIRIISGDVLSSDISFLDVEYLLSIHGGKILFMIFNAMLHILSRLKSISKRNVKFQTIERPLLNISIHIYKAAFSFHLTNSFSRAFQYQQVKYQNIKYLIEMCPT